VYWQKFVDARGESTADTDVENLELKTETEVMGDSVG
jgi:hypothetical protein